MDFNVFFNSITVVVVGALCTHNVVGAVAYQSAKDFGINFVLESPLGVRYELNDDVVAYWVDSEGGFLLVPKTEEVRSVSVKNALGGGTNSTKTVLEKGSHRLALEADDEITVALDIIDEDLVVFC